MKRSAVVLLVGITMLWSLVLVAAVQAAPAAPVTHVLAIAFMHKLDTIKPYFVMPHTSREACMLDAEQRSRKEADLLQSLGDGAEFVCMPIERVTV